MSFEYVVFTVDVLIFKQKTAYELRISDWSSDVCSSDLAVRAHRERRDQRTRIGHAPRGNEGNFELVGGAWQQDHVRHVIFARMAAAFEAVDAHRVAPDRLGFQCMTHRGAFMDDLDSRSEEHTSELQSLMRISYAVFCLKKKN